MRLYEDLSLKSPKMRLMRFCAVSCVVRATYVSYEGQVKKDAQSFAFARTAHIILTGRLTVTAFF
jgi:hypothetical protein